jgi:hypothetical protein
MEDFKNENIQLHIKINELTNKLVELANENKQLKEDYTKAYMMNLDFLRIYDIHNTEEYILEIEKNRKTSYRNCKK